MVGHLIHSKSAMVLGPLQIKEYPNFLSKFQAIDMMAMMGVTAGGLFTKSTFLANGGNIAFIKSAFVEVGGYSKANKASGDDVMLMHKFIASNKRVSFLKATEAIVETFAITTLNELLMQRKRWATKTIAYISKKDKIVAICTFLFFASIIINLLLSFFFGGVTFFIALFQLFIKIGIDYLFLVQINQFFNLSKLLKTFIPLSLLQFLIFVYSGMMSLISKKYIWKGKKLQ